MTSQYDSYRFQQTGTDPYQLSYSNVGAIPNTPSTSVWGNMREGIVPAALLSIAAPPLAPAILAAGAWYGHNKYKKAKKERERILNERRQQVENWRKDTYNKLINEMRAHGEDVVRDLEGELKQALAAGGDLGDPDAIQNSMLQFQQRYRDYMIGRQRAYQARTVDSMFADPRREQERAQRLAAERELGRNQINEAYRLGLTGNAMQQARRGMLGGSTDVEARGALQTARDAQFMQLESGLQEKARQYRLNDEALRQQLLGMIYAEDPMTAQQFAGMLQGIQQQGEAFREQRATEAQLGQTKQLFANQVSQSLGGALSSAAPAIQLYIMRSAGA